MKKIKKITAFLMTLTICLMFLGSNQAFAATGWGDTFEEAITIYQDGNGDSDTSVPIDNCNDQDWYVIDNTLGFSFNFTLYLTPPSGINYDMQIVRVDANGNITSNHYVYDNGAGKMDAVGTDVQAGCKIYVRVMSHGSNDYDTERPYDLRFAKSN